MKRLWPWLLTTAVDGGLLSALGMMIGEWIATSHGLVAATFLLLYAAATSTFGAWRSFALTAVPALWILEFALFMDAEAYDCYPACSTYQDILGWGLTV